MEAIIKTKRQGKGEYTVTLTVGVQTFTLAYTRPKDEAKWMAEQLRTAIGNIAIKSPKKNKHLTK